MAAAPTQRSEAFRRIAARWIQTPDPQASRVLFDKIFRILQLQWVLSDSTPYSILIFDCTLQFKVRCLAIFAIMVPRLAPWAPSITDTPPTPIEHQESPIAEQRRSRSQQLLDTFMHEARSRSSSGSSRHSKSPDGVKGVLANLGLAAATVGAEHIKPKSPHDEDVREGVKVFLSALQNIILRRARTGCGDDVETIEVWIWRSCSNGPRLTGHAGRR
jgi:hypothetical protein